MDVNCAIDDLIDNLEPLELNPPRLEVLHHKFFAKLKEDLECLSQVEGGFGSSMRSWRRIWIVYYKSKEYLDRLLQVGGIFGSSTTSQRRTSQHPSKGSHPGRLLRFHQRRTTLIKWPPRPDGASILVGRARALEGHKSSKLPSSAHLVAPPSRSGGPEHWKGTSPPSYPIQPTFLRL
jgi:hypothetical protein